MEDLAGKINDLLSSPEGMQQLNSLASMLGLGGSGSTPNTTPGQQNTAANPLQGLDLSNLANLLGGSSGGNIPSMGDSSNSGLDAASLNALLSGLSGGGGGSNPLGALSGLLGGNNADGGNGLGALSGLLGGGGSDGGGNPLGALSGLLGGNGMDGDTIKTIMKLAPLLSTFRQEDNNTRLLHALRPLLGPERQKKLDEAVRILSMLRLVPLLKGQGIL